MTKNNLARSVLTHDRAEKYAFLKMLAAQYSGNAVENQRKRIVEALSRFPVTTVEIRRHLDVMEVAERIWELRHVFGFAIDKIMVDDVTDLGRKHKVALYVMPAGDSL